jgi:Fe-Mn family superoxide dismutase
MFGAGALASASGGFTGRAMVQAQPAPAAAPAAAKPFTLPPLGYAYEALEPDIDTVTMLIHHDTHHAAYVNNLNGLVAKWPALATTPMEDILFNLAMVPNDVRTGVRNNLGGHWNHSFFWELMAPHGAKAPAGDVLSAINGAFDGVDKMKAAVKQAGITQFGSGWAWLAVTKDKKLAVFSTANQDTPHMYVGAKPILGIDVWEHAYYLKHQAKRAEYIDVWWNTVNWDKVAANFKKASA